MRLALQLSSYQDSLKKDLQKTLQQIREAGFQNIEVTEMSGDSNESFAEALRDAGLNTVALHVQLHHLRARFNDNIGYAELLDAEWLVIPIVQLDEYGSGWERLGKELLGYVRDLGAFGRRLAFHPNKAEFRPDRGRTGLHFLFDGSERSIDIEFDLTKATQSSANPVEWMTTLTNRVPLLTVDMAQGEAGDAHPAYAVWQGVKAAAKANGVQWVIVKVADGPGDRVEELVKVHELFANDGLLD